MSAPRTSRQNAGEEEEEEDAGGNDEDEDGDDSDARLLLQQQQQQQQAYLEFMLQKSVKSNQKKKNNNKGSLSAAVDKPPPHSSRAAVKKVDFVSPQQQQQFQRKMASIVKSFAGMLQRDWLEVDETLGNVMSSVAHLRYRIALEQKELAEMERNDELYQDDDDWKSWGFHASSGNSGGMALTRTDLNLALSRDLLQHESMCSGARRLLASLAQTQDALGRRLDEMMQLEMSWTSATTTANESDSSGNRCDTVVGHCQELYSSLALELYRKQRLVFQVLESVHDGVLWSKTEDRLDRRAQEKQGDGAKGIMYGGILVAEESKSIGTLEDPILVAERCVKQWPLHCQSHWDVQRWEQVQQW